MKNLLEIENLHTEIDGKTIHQNLSFNIYNGEIVSIMGRSGTGKTTLANVILGFISPKHCTLKWLGKKLILKNIFRKIGFQPQHGSLLSDYNILDNVAMPLRYVANLSWDIAYELAYMKIKLVGLSSVDCEKYPHTLSGGMIKRAALARALALDPPLIILDEPLSGLDAKSSKEFESLIWSLIPDVSIICITHNLIKSHRYMVLEDKKIVEKSVDEIRSGGYAQI